MLSLSDNLSITVIWTNYMDSLYADNMLIIFNNFKMTQLFAIFKDCVIKWLRGTGVLAGRLQPDVVGARG